MKVTNEERMFMGWCETLEHAGLLKSWSFNDENCRFILSEPVVMTFRKKLKTKYKVEEKNILQGCVYTCDFKLYGLDSRVASACGFPLSADNNYFVETKGPKLFQNHTSDATAFPKRCWVFQKYGHFVNLCKMPTFFKYTFFPIIPEITLKKNGEVRSPFLMYKDFSDFKKSRAL